MADVKDKDFECPCNSGDVDTSPCYFWDNKAEPSSDPNPRACICLDFALQGSLPS